MNRAHVRTRLALLALVPALLALSACAPEAAPLTDDSPATSAPSTTPTADPEPQAPVQVDPADYLVKGSPVDDDGDGFWSAYYAFYTDDSRSVRCEIATFSGDDPSTLCSIVAGKEGSATYELPTGPEIQCDPSTANPADGYALGLNGKSLYPATAGFTTCAEWREVEPDVAAATRVLGDGQKLTVEPFTCSSTTGVAYCAYTDDTGGITLGLTTASFTS